MTFSNSTMQCAFRYPSWLGLDAVQSRPNGSVGVQLTGGPGNRLCFVGVYRNPVFSGSPAQGLAVWRRMQYQTLGKHLVAVTLARVVTMRGLRGFVFGDIVAGPPGHSFPRGMKAESESWTLWDSKATYEIILLEPLSAWKHNHTRLEMIPETFEPQ